MTVKDIKDIIPSSVSIHLYVAKTIDDAINEHSEYRYIFNKYTNLSNCYAKLEVVYVYPEQKDDLEVWALMAE